MEEKFNRKKELLSEKLDFPKDVVLDFPKIIVVGKKEVTIENHKGIIVFNDKLIKISSRIGEISIQGKNFEILYIASSTITISGEIEGINYGE